MFTTAKDRPLSWGSTTTDSGSTSSTVRVTVLPLGTIDRPASIPTELGWSRICLTRLLTYNPQTVCALFPFFTQRL